MFEKSGLGRYYTSLERRNPSTSSGSNDDPRKEYFSTVPCDTLELLLNSFQVDFLMFGYDASPFFELCMKRGHRQKFGDVSAEANLSAEMSVTESAT